MLEIRAGVDGFMVYDLNLIQPMQEVSRATRHLHSFTSTVHLYEYKMSSPQLFQSHTEGENQLHVLRHDVSVTPEDLLSMPSVSQHHLHLFPVAIKPDVFNLHISLSPFSFPVFSLAAG